VKTVCEKLRVYHSELKAASGSDYKMDSVDVRADIINKLSPLY
jgi:hypothetical protein